MLKKDQTALDETTHLLNSMAIRICQSIPADLAARCFVGVGLGLMRMTLGDEIAAAYFRQFSDALAGNVDSQEIGVTGLLNRIPDLRN